MRENPWSQAFERYLEHRRRRGLSPGRLKVEKCTLRRLATFCHRARIVDPQGLSPRKFEAFVRYLQTQYRCPQAYRAHRLSPKTILDTVIVIRGLLAFLVREGDLLLDPARFFWLRPDPRRLVTERAIRPDQMKVLIRSLKKEDSLRAFRDRAILEILFGCGLRLAELVGLDLGDINLQAGIVRVRHAKGGRERLVPIAGTARRILRRYLTEVRPQLVTAASGSALILTSQGGRRLGAAMVGYMVRHLARKAGRKQRLTPHMFRHGYATALIRGGAGVRQVQVLLGHRRVASTEVYTAVAIEDLQRVHARTHPREQIS